MRAPPDGAFMEIVGLLFYSLRYGFDHRSAEVGVEHGWMHITLSADGGSVSETASATALMACTTFFFAWVCDSNISNSRSMVTPGPFPPTYESPWR